MIHPIHRFDDPRMTSYARVGDPAWLRANNLFVAEGRLVVCRLFTLRRHDVESVLGTPTAIASLRDALPADATVYVAEQQILNSVTGFNFHRGCLALARRPAPLDARTFSSSHRLLALEGIGNPDNVGGIFRNAAAFGVDGVLLDPTSGDPLYRKAIRTSMGAVLSVPFARLESWPHDLARLKEQGFSILALTPSAQAESIETVANAIPHCWILLAGAEGPGLTEETLAIADVHIRIPIVESVDSLNVTVAIGIALSRLSGESRV